MPFTDFLHLFLPNDAAPSDRNAVFETIADAKFFGVPVLFVEDEDCAPEAFRAGPDKLHARKRIVIHPVILSDFVRINIDFSLPFLV